MVLRPDQHPDGLAVDHLVAGLEVDDLTRQYLLQIIAEHESRGENVLPVDVLTDLVRSYTSQAGSIVPGC